MRPPASSFQPSTKTPAPASAGGDSAGARRESQDPKLAANARTARTAKALDTPSTKAPGKLEKFVNWAGGKVKRAVDLKTNVQDGFDDFMHKTGTVFGRMVDTRTKGNDLGITQVKGWVDRKIDGSSLPSSVKSTLKVGASALAFDATVANHESGSMSKTIFSGVTDTLGFAAKYGSLPIDPARQLQVMESTRKFVTQQAPVVGSRLSAAYDQAKNDPVGLGKQVVDLHQQAGKQLLHAAVETVKDPRKLGDVTGVVLGNLALAAVPVGGEASAGLRLTETGANAARQVVTRRVVNGTGAALDHVGVDVASDASRAGTRVLRDVPTGPPTPRTLQQGLEGSFTAKDGTRALIEAQPLADGRQGVSWVVRAEGAGGAPGEVLGRGVRVIDRGELSAKGGEALIYEQARGKGIATEVYRRMRESVPSGTRLSVDSTNAETNQLLNQARRNAAAQAEKQGLAPEARNELIGRALDEAATNTPWGRALAGAGWKLDRVEQDAGYVLHYVNP